MWSLSSFRGRQSVQDEKANMGSRTDSISLRNKSLVDKDDILSRIPIVPFLNENGMKTSRVKGGKEKLRERQAAKVGILVHSMRCVSMICCVLPKFFSACWKASNIGYGCLNIALDQMKRLSAPLPHHLCQRDKLVPDLRWDELQIFAVRMTITEAYGEHAYGCRLMKRHLVLFIILVTVSRCNVEM